MKVIKPAVDIAVHLLVNRYNNSKRTDQYEPSYTLSPYDVVLDYAGVGKSKLKDLAVLKNLYGNEFNDKQLLAMFSEEVVEPLLMPDGTVAKGGGLFPDRVIHDGFKVGTNSWVFMGRKDSPVVPIKYHDTTLYAIKRTIPAKIAAQLKPLHPEVDNDVWCAYDLDGKYGFKIGPCISLDHIHQVASGHGHFSIRIIGRGLRDETP